MCARNAWSHEPERAHAYFWLLFSSTARSDTPRADCTLSVVLQHSTSSSHPSDQLLYSLFALMNMEEDLSYTAVLHPIIVSIDVRQRYT